MFVRLLCVLVVIQCSIALHAQVDSLPRDANGWTVFTPAADSRIIYVSSSEGDDDTGTYYDKDAAEIGADPFQPAGAIMPYATVSAAFAVARDGYPDWVLFKKGDVWYSGCNAKNGRGLNEMFLVSSYGSGARPLFKFGSGSGLSKCCSEQQYYAVVGVHLYAHTRNPDDPEYVGPAKGNGIRLFEGTLGLSYSILIEDCVIDFVQSTLYRLQDFVFRRNIITNAYSVDSHSQGVYASHLDGAIFEENFFDHNGWLIQSTGGGTGAADGQATIFNHNTYFTDCSDVTFRENIFSRASSMGNKWRADETGGSTGIVLVDNLYIDGELGIGIGGNTDNPHRFVDVRIEGNVFTDMGRSQPTNRTLAWNLPMADWDGGTVTRNLIVNQKKDVVRNTFAIRLKGTMRNVAIEDNVVCNLLSNKGLVLTGDPSGHENVTFHGNYVQSPTYAVPLIETGTEGATGYDFSENSYYSVEDEFSWFESGSTQMDFIEWESLQPETRSVDTQAYFAEPTRNADSYASNVLGLTNYEDFVATMITQSKDSWNENLRTRAILHYIRQGFSVGIWNNGVINVEAENLSKQIVPDTDSWQLVADAGADGGYALQALPNDGTSTTDPAVAPRLDYLISFLAAGDYYIWLKRYAETDADNTIRFALDDGVYTSFDCATGAWAWEKIGTITVGSHGLRSLRIAMEDDGFMLDKVLVTDDMAFTPGSGPIATNILTTPSALTVAEEGSGTIQVKLSNAPGTTVTVNLSLTGDNDLTLSDSSPLTFTDSDWNTAQTITINAAEDADYDDGTAILAFTSTQVNNSSMTISESDDDIEPAPLAGDGGSDDDGGCNAGSHSGLSVCLLLLLVVGVALRQRTSASCTT